MSVKTKQVDTWYTDRLRSTFTNCIFIKHNNKLTWFFFSTEDYFNSLEHCQSKQTVSYNVEWCLQLQYVECSGDTWYCDTELLSKLHLQNRPDFRGDHSRRLSLTAEWCTWMEKKWGWHLPILSLSGLTRSLRFLETNKQMLPPKRK